MPRYIVHTFGCQMNVHDSDRMEEVLRAHGWEETASFEDAELVVFNTCSVREKAEQKLRSEVGKLAPLKRRKHRGLIVAVAGCVAQQEGEKLLSRVPHIDLVVGPDNLAELPMLVAEQMAGGPPRARTVFDLEAPRFLAAAPVRGAAPVSAFVTTMKGCDERCSFCIVPYTRGPERYRPADEIVAEVARWVDSGAREVTLLGQTVDSYKDPRLASRPSEDPDESQFPELLRAIAANVKGLRRLRYTSPHPRHATAALAAAHATLDLVREIGFTSLFGFKYSPRPFTPALRLKDDVSEEEKSERLARLFEVSEELTRAHLSSLVGSVQQVLVEGPGKTPKTWSGRTSSNEIVHIDGRPAEGRVLVGQIVEVSITHAFKHSLAGVPTAAAVQQLPREERPASMSDKRRSLPLLL